MLFYGYSYLEKPNIRIHSQLSALIAGFAVLAFIALNLVPPRHSIVAYMQPYAPILPVFAALIAHLGEVRISWKPAVLLGDASYVLYLFHVNVIEMIRGIATYLPVLDFKAVPGMLLVLTLASLMAIALHRHVELPLLQACRRHFFTRDGGKEPGSVTGEPG